MIIRCKDRRIIADRYGYRIEIQKTLGKKSKTPGEKVWTEDAPAYPSTLTHALEMIFEREVKDSGEITPDGLLDTLKACIERSRQYMKEIQKFKE